MLKSFRHKGLEKFFATESKAGIQGQHAKRLRIQLTALEHATSAKDMNAPGWHFHKLTGDRAGFYSALVSGNRRLVSRFDGVDVVDLDYVDYH